MDVTVPRYVGRGMPQQGLHCAEGSSRRVEQTRCEVTQPVPIKFASSLQDTARSSTLTCACWEVPKPCVVSAAA